MSLASTVRMVKISRSICLWVFIALLFHGCSDDKMMITGKMANITLKNSAGAEVKITYQQDLLLIVFWATWCQPCIMEIPSLVEVHKKYKDRGFEVVSILTDKPGLETVRQIENHFNINYEILMGNETLAAQFGINAFPTAFLITKGGKVVDKMMGMTPHDLLESKIDFHLAK